MSDWIMPSVAVPMDGEEVLAEISGTHGGIRYDHEVVCAIYDQGVWYLDDGVVDEDLDKCISVHCWMYKPRPMSAPGKVLIDGKELINRLILISASAAQWSGPRVISEAIKEARSLMPKD